MWIFTTFGFFSVVCARRDKNKADQFVSHDILMVRARDFVHLENLRDRCDILKHHRIIHSTDTDYPVRMIVTKAEWLFILSCVTADLNFSNFKEKIMQVADDDFRMRDYSKSLGDVWYRMREIQDDTALRRTDTMERTPKENPIEKVRGNSYL